MAFELSTTQSATGAQLQLYRMSAPTTKKNPARAVLQINHGMAEHGARYQRFAEQLTGHGYHVVVHDHRGHGNTKAADAPLGVFAAKDGLQTALSDMHHVNQMIREEYLDLPIILFGHSMGTILGFNYCLRYPQTIDGAALWNSGFDSGLLNRVFRFLLIMERIFKGSDVPSKIAQKLTFEDWNKKFTPNRTDFDWLSRDEAEVDKYVEDPLCGFPVSVGMWLNVLEAIDTGANDSNLSALPHNLPIHLQAGEKDPCSVYGKAVARLHDRLKSTGLKDVTFKLLTDTRHESLNEINRDETTEDFINWLDQRFSKD